jgi:Protein of unknown function (DUF3443)
VRKLGLLLVLGSLSLLAACGGGGGSNGNGTITGVSVSCSPSTVTSGQTSQCSATVTGTGNFSSAVSWTANNNATITSAGLLTAPMVTSATTVTVTATSSQNSAISGTATVTVNPQTVGANVAPIVVDSGPDPANFTSTNVPFVTVTICVPGTTTCQTIDHVTVDTGSSGFRVISSVLSLSLPAEDLSSGNPLYECTVFLDGYVWGSVATANITVSGETASNVPVQIMIPSTTSPAPPSSCSNQTTGSNEGGSVDAFGANAIIGVGLFQQDCGPACTTQNSTIPDVYYDCPSSGCTPSYVTLAQQLPNPVTMFAADNNGVLLQLPSVPDGGSPTVDGSLIFGIGTETNNGLGSAVIYQVPDSGNNAGDFITTYSGQTYPQSFVDSGSNGYYFLDSAITGIPTCPGSGNLAANTWYCPTTSPDSLTATNQGQNAAGTPVGTAVTVNFSIENTQTLFNTNNTAFSTLSGPIAATCGTGSNPTCVFDWGLSFFYGRNMFTAIDNMSTPGGTGPYFAF